MKQVQFHFCASTTHNCAHVVAHKGDICAFCADNKPCCRLTPRLGASR